MSALQKAVAALMETHRQFNNGELSPVAHGNNRETHLAEALRAVAAKTGVTLREPLRIDSNGEFSIVAVPTEPTNIPGAAGRYSDEFVALLNRHNPRCGVLPTAHLLPENGWCRMNHFDVERLVLEAHAEAVRG